MQYWEFLRGLSSLAGKDLRDSKMLFVSKAHGSASLIAGMGVRGFYVYISDNPLLEHRNAYYFTEWYETSDFIKDAISKFKDDGYTL